MWLLPNLIMKTGILDFTSSGQGEISASQLWKDDIRLINSYELVDFDNSPYQFEVCNECGITGCAPGGWVDLRRSANVILLTPAYESIHEEDYLLSDEYYYPPYYLIDSAVGYINTDEYVKYFTEWEKFPNVTDIVELSSWEAAKVYQSDAPDCVIGKLNSVPKLEKNSIIASSEGDTPAQEGFLIRSLGRMVGGSVKVEIKPILPGDKIVTLYLDFDVNAEWKALVVSDDEMFLYLSPVYKISVYK